MTPQESATKFWNEHSELIRLKPTEIRIGNRVLYYSTYISVDVDIEILLKIIHKKDIFYCGIPITGHWLKLYGFKETKNNWYEKTFDNNNDDYLFVLAYNTDSFRVAIYNSDKIDYETIYPKEIECVHQLQNLYFALSGCELVLKEA
jgi:hypothetical protein